MEAFTTICFYRNEQQQSSEADDMFLHDADLMMWDETMDVLVSE